LKDKFRKEKYYMLYLCCYKSYIGERKLEEMYKYASGMSMKLVNQY